MVFPTCQTNRVCRKVGIKYNSDKGYMFSPEGVDQMVRLKKIQWIACPTTQPVRPSSRPRTYHGPGTVLNALDQFDPRPLPAQRGALNLVIVAGIVPSYGQGTRQSHFRNDPMKYDLKFTLTSTWSILTYWWFMRNLPKFVIQCKL